MNNFIFQNPVRIIFGKGVIADLPAHIPAGSKILMTCGGGSIRANGVYDQVKKALSGFQVLEFWGIEPNPHYETCMKAVEICRREKITFLLSVGGGSVLDATKFISLAAFYTEGDPWDLCSKGATVSQTIPLGSVITLPATGSEMNFNAVISRDSTHEKLALADPKAYPVFSIMDPEVTFSLPERQSINGIVDAFVHVCEQYMTYPVNAPLQDRQAEAVLHTLVEEGPKVLKNPKDYDARANIMWAATHALNFIMACGVPQDWSTHMIGHEITALHGLDHAQTLACVLLGVFKHQKKEKGAKLAQYGRRIWGIAPGPDAVEKAIDQTETFFRSLGMKTHLKEYGVGTENFEKIASRIQDRGMKLGEHANIGKKEILEILNLSL